MNNKALNTVALNDPALALPIGGASEHKTVSCSGSAITKNIATGISASSSFISAGGTVYIPNQCFGSRNSHKITVSDGFAATQSTAYGLSYHREKNSGETLPFTFGNIVTLHSGQASYGRAIVNIPAHGDSTHPSSINAGQAETGRFCTSGMLHPSFMNRGTAITASVIVAGASVHLKMCCRGKSSAIRENGILSFYRDEVIIPVNAPPTFTILQYERG